MPALYTSLHDPALIGALARGQVGVLPTDTLYGLVCPAASQVAAERLYGTKGRLHKPGTVVAATIEQLIGLGFKGRYLKAVENYWPGPVSVIIPTHELAYLHLGVGGVAVRIPGDKEFSRLLSTTGPLLTTSANQPDQPPANTIAQARDYFGDTVDFYVDGGDLSGRQPSTIIRVVDDAVEILREGAVTIDPNTGEILK